MAWNAAIDSSSCISVRLLRDASDEETRNGEEIRVRLGLLRGLGGKMEAE